MTLLPFAPLPSATDADQRVAALYLASRAPGVSTASAASSLNLLARLLGCAGYVSCAWTCLDYEHAMHLRRALQEGRTPRTVNTHLSTLRGLARLALDAEIGDAARWTRLLKVKYVAWDDDDEPGRAFNASEVAAILADCDRDTSPERGARDRFLIELMWATGLRVSTVAALLWPESVIDVVGGVALSVTTKGNKRHTIPMDASIVAAFGAYLTLRGDWPGALICQVTRGRPPHRLVKVGITRSGIYDVIVKRSAAAGLERATPHDMRRTFITDMISIAGLRTAQLLAGHKSPAQTAKYDRAGHRRMADAVNRRPLPDAGRDDGPGDTSNGAPHRGGDGDEAG